MSCPATSGTLTPSSGPPTPPSYRKPQPTTISPVDASHISLELSPAPRHPYDNLSIRVTSPETEKALTHAADLIREGKTVAFPTETVYGLAADATSSVGVRAIYDAKQRPSDNPLIVHVSSLQQLRSLLPRKFSAASLPSFCSPEKPQEQDETIPAVYLPLLRRFWPGPLTILLPLPNPSPLSPLVTATQPTFAARMPAHPIALALTGLSGRPIAAPSANASTKPSPTAAKHVLDDLSGRIPLILDGGPSDVGVESTVVDGLRFPPVVLRPGGVSVEDIRSCGGVWESCESILRAENGEVDDHAPRAPGMKYQHYSPRAQVVLHEHGAHLPTGKELVQSVRRKGKVGVLRTRTWPEGFAKKAVAEEVEKDREKKLAKKRAKTNGTTVEDGVESAEVEVIEWSLGDKGSEISRSLFKGLRDLDRLEVNVIYVEGIAEEAEGLAIMNRLYKAASIVVRNVSYV